MENQEQKTLSNFKKWMWIILITMFFIGSHITSYLIITSQNDKLEANNSLLIEQELGRNTCDYKRDSLFREVKQLSIYKSLTKAMVYRDEASSLLKHKIGDVVYAKRDSSQGVVSDIIIGGSNYQYYIKYTVLYKGNKESENLIPELIY